MGLSERWSQQSQRLSMELPGFPVLIEFRLHRGVTSQEWKAPSFFIDPIWEVKIDHQPSWAHRHRPQHLHGLLSVIHSFCQGVRQFSAQNCVLVMKKPCLLDMCIRPGGQVMPTHPTSLGGQVVAGLHYGEAVMSTPLPGRLEGLWGEALTLGGGIPELSTRHISFFTWQWARKGK